MPNKSVKDPVCGMEIKAKNVEHRSQHNGKSYYFCSSTCKSQFESNPSQYERKVA